MSDPRRELEWLRRARELSHRLVDEIEPERLLPEILASAIELSGAERGFVVRLVGEQRKVCVEVARGFDGQILRRPEGAVSRRVVEEVLKRDQRGVVTTREEDEPLLAGTTVRERHVLAILCVPMRLRGRAVGVIYLDHRFLADAFRPEDVEPLRVFADQAALALEARELSAARAEERRELERARARLADQEALERRRRRLLSLQRSQRAAGASAALGELLGQSEAAQGFFVDLERAGRSLDPVLVAGETGSGKSAAAREVHQLSGLEGPLVALDCALAGEEILERLAEAAGGTLLLEEIGAASEEAQLQLARELQRQRAESGGARIVATHTGLPQDLRLRADLLYRLDVLRVDVPALRHRSEDVPLLLDHFSDAAGRRLECTPNALQLLVEFDWPGNLHQLDALVRRLVSLGKTITTRDLPSEVQAGGGAEASAGATTIADMERGMIERALRECGGNKSRVSRQLGIPRSSLYRLLDRYGLR